MDKQEAVIIDRALTQLSDPVLAKMKSGRRLEQVLTGAKASGDLPADDLRRAADALVAEIDVRKFIAKAGGTDDETAANSGLALLILLVLLLALLALADEGTDIAYLIQQLIDLLLGKG